MVGDERVTYTVNEVAKKLGIGRNQCYEAIARGEVPAIRVGKRLLVPHAALDRLLDQGRAVESACAVNPGRAA